MWITQWKHKRIPKLFCMGKHLANICICFFPLNDIYFCKYSSSLFSRHHNGGMHFLALNYVMLQQGIYNHIHFPDDCKSMPRSCFEFWKISPVLFSILLLHEYLHLESLLKLTFWGSKLILQFTRFIQFMCTLNTSVISFFSYLSHYIFFDTVSFNQQSTVWRFTPSTPPHKVESKHTVDTKRFEGTYRPYTCCTRHCSGC